MIFWGIFEPPIDLFTFWVEMDPFHHLYQSWYPCTNWCRTSSPYM